MLSLLTLLLACTGPGPEGCPIGDGIDGDDRLATCAAEIDECDTYAVVGTGAGGAFREFDNEEVVSLDVAPQGGFGVSVKVRTSGLLAGDQRVALITLDVEQDGVNVGTHNQPVSLLCQENGEGEVFGVVVGFDSDTYSTNDDLLQLDGAVVTLKVTLEDEAGTTITGETVVTVNVGG